jgi:hypothetical protein
VLSPNFRVRSSHARRPRTPRKLLASPRPADSPTRQARSTVLTAFYGPPTAGRKARLVDWSCTARPPNRFSVAYNHSRISKQLLERTVLGWAQKQCKGWCLFASKRRGVLPSSRHVEADTNREPTPAVYACPPRPAEHALPSPRQRLQACARGAVRPSGLPPRPFREHRLRPGKGLQKLWVPKAPEQRRKRNSMHSS